MKAQLSIELLFVLAALIALLYVFVTTQNAITSRVKSGLSAFENDAFLHENSSFCGAVYFNWDSINKTAFGVDCQHAHTKGRWF